MSGLATVVAFWKHMRMGFQLLLAPLFLWGLYLGGGGVDAAVVVGFVSLHLFLYPGATAFNSAYDRDEGPVSGMFEPEGLPPHLLAFSIALQLIGALLALAVGLVFTLIYGGLALAFAGYSHPRTRWKANPAVSAAFVFFGQGVLGFAAGWCAGTGGFPAPDSRGFLGAFVAGATALGLYPSTQIFQTEEDARRGDRTLAVALGPAAALRLGSFCLAAAGLGALWLTLRELTIIEAAGIAAAFTVLILRHELFARELRTGQATTERAYAWATATRLWATFFFLGFLALEFWRIA